MRTGQTMRRMILTGLAAVVAGCASPSGQHFAGAGDGANVYVAPEHRSIRKVAVLPLKAPTELIGASVADVFITEILRSGRYELVERGQMANVLGEAELALAGLSASRAAEVGQMLGADGVIVGTVSEYENTARGGRTYPVVGISARLIDCVSGKIIWSVDLARRAQDSRVTLPEHARAVVHDMVAAVYKATR